MAAPLLVARGSAEKLREEEEEVLTGFRQVVGVHRAEHGVLRDALVELLYYQGEPRVASGEIVNASIHPTRSSSSSFSSSFSTAFRGRGRERGRFRRP